MLTSRFPGSDDARVAIVKDTLTASDTKRHLALGNGALSYDLRGASVSERQLWWMEVLCGLAGWANDVDQIAAAARGDMISIKFDDPVVMLVFRDGPAEVQKCGSLIRG
jgi:hypothetical protein